MLFTPRKDAHAGLGVADPHKLLKSAVSTFGSAQRRIGTIACAPFSLFSGHPFDFSKKFHRVSNLCMQHFPTVFHGVPTLLFRWYRLHAFVF
jgi:hypothetical protein